METNRWLIHSPNTDWVKEILNLVGLKTPIEVSCSTWFAAKWRSRRTRSSYLFSCQVCLSLHPSRPLSLPLSHTHTHIHSPCLIFKGTDREGWGRKTPSLPAAPLSWRRHRAHAICRTAADPSKLSELPQALADAHFSPSLGLHTRVKVST